MKKHIIAAFVIVLVCVSAVFIYIGFGNIDSLKVSSTYTEEEIENKIAENNKSTEVIIKEITTNDFRVLTEDESVRVETGEITEKEAIELVTGNKPEDTSEADSIIARIYVTKGKFVNKLKNLIAQAKREYLTTPKAKNDIGFKMSFARRYLSEGNALERECDVEMEQLLKSLESELVRSGKDTSIIGDIKKSYEQEKKLKKAEIINKYKTKAGI